MSKINELQEIIDSSENIVFFGGAGVSTESGIPDFRSADGIYSKTPEELVSHTYYLEHTEEFFKFYKENGIVFFSVSTRALDIVKDAELGISRYPFAHLNWEEKEGSAIVPILLIGALIALIFFLPYISKKIEFLQVENNIDSTLFSL